MQLDLKPWVPWNLPVCIEKLSSGRKMLRGVSGHIVILQAMPDGATLVTIRRGREREQYLLDGDMEVAEALAIAWLVQRAEGIVGAN